MASSDKQTGAGTAAGSRADQVRSAVEGAFQAAGAQIGRDRALDLADELASAAHRVREALEELRPPTADDLKRFDERLGAIERRLAALEGAARAPKPRAAPKSRAAARPAVKAKPAAKKPSS